MLMRVALIAAAAENGIIGRDNQLPWHLPDEFRHFKQTTEGHHVIMGRRTWESRGKPLPRRVNIVVTSRTDYSAPGAIIVGSLAEALRVAEAAGESEAFVIGGTLLYAEALATADRLYLTRVHASFEGDAVFPSYDESLWREVDRREHSVDDRHPFAFSIRTLDRVR
jgi:dihydrofolate reductase